MKPDLAFSTDRKRAVGLGAAHTGTAHHIGMHVTSVALVILVPLFLATFGRILGEPWPVVAAYYARPFPAIVAGLTLIVGLRHFHKGAQVLVEDYWSGITRQALIMAVIVLTYGAMATGLFAIARLALTPSVVAVVAPA